MESAFLEDVGKFISGYKAPHRRLPFFFSVPTEARVGRSGTAVFILSLGTRCR